MKRVSRLVILPDYQGIGLGTRFLDVVANYYDKHGFVFSIVTSAKNLIKSLCNKNNWCLINYGKHNIDPLNIKNNKVIRQTNRINCKTASFQYKGITKRISKK